MNSQFKIETNLVCNEAKTVIQLELFIIDLKHKAYVLDNLVGKASLNFQSGSVAFEIDFDDYFGTEAGSFLISFCNLPNYPLKDIKLTIKVVDAFLEKTVPLSDYMPIKSSSLDYLAFSDA